MICSVWVIISTCRSQSGADVGLLEGRTRDGARVCAGPQRAQEGHTALTQVVWCLMFGYTAVRENGPLSDPSSERSPTPADEHHMCEPPIHHAQMTNRSLGVSASPSLSTGTADLQPRNRSTGISAPACIPTHSIYQHSFCVSFWSWSELKHLTQPICDPGPQNQS